MAIKRHYNIPNLVRELAENRISPLEILREALSNAKDHLARRLWIKTSKDNRNEVSLILVDDGEGMNDERLQAFWGVGASHKENQSIGYKGHGTKLYFDCERLSVVTRVRTEDDWCLTRLEQPLKACDDEVPVEPLTPAHPLHQELADLGLLDGTGTAISIDQLRSEDRAVLLSRAEIESYCDWFTVIGDIRSGLFDKRVDFHRALLADDEALSSLRLQDAELRPIEVLLCINGERKYTYMGMGPGAKNKEFLTAWKEDREEHERDRPGLLAFGHRFANAHEAKHGATRVRDDLSALRLTSPATWTNSAGISIVARVEGHRRQRSTYLEASWQGKPGIYNFQQRFGLWLCRDFIPVTQRNELLRQALEQAPSRKLKFELGSLRNWQVFVNDQQLKPTANRNDIANKALREAEIVAALVKVLETALAQKPFRDWIDRLQAAAHERNRDREIAHIQRRLDDVQDWLNGEAGFDLADVGGLIHLDPDVSLRLREPTSEQELFYIYALLSGRHEMPLQIVEYNTNVGIDTIGTLRVPALLAEKKSLVRVELKHEVRAGYPIHHFFDAIDVILCWKVDKVGDIWEETSATQGTLRKRSKSILDPPMDTHEIVYDSGEQSRTIPVLQLATLFTKARPSRRRR